MAHCQKRPFASEMIHRAPTKYGVFRRSHCENGITLRRYHIGLMRNRLALMSPGIACPISTHEEAGNDIMLAISRLASHRE